MREKITAIAIAITTICIFGLWQIAVPYSIKYEWLKPIIAAAFSYGIYSFLIVTLGRYLPNVKFIKRWLFGRDYLDGVWVGAYVGCTLEPRVFYEEYDQQFETVTVRGRSFLLDGTPHATWTSTSFNISHEHDKIFFTYSAQSFTAEPSGNGYAQFTPVLDNKGRFIRELRGFSFDLHNGIMIPALEKKLDKKSDEKSLIESAKALYSDNKLFFDKQRKVIESKLSRLREA